MGRPAGVARIAGKSSELVPRPTVPALAQEAEEAHLPCLAAAATAAETVVETRMSTETVAQSVETTAAERKTIEVA